MSLFLHIIQVKFVTRTQSLINRLGHELCKILEPMFKNQQNVYDINNNNKKVSQYIYCLFPDFPYSNISISQKL